MSIGRICLREVDVAHRGETAKAAAERMRQRNVGSLVVVAGDRKPIGILTDRDLVLRVLAEGLDPQTTTVEQAMTTEPKCVDESTPIERALGMMRSGNFRRLPVVDGEGDLLGMATLDDVLALLAGEFRAIGTLLERESPRSVALD